MRKVLQTILVFSITASFWLPQADVAEAGQWHAPQGYMGLWTVEGPICQNGVQVTRIGPDEVSGANFHEDGAVAFSAHIAYYTLSFLNNVDEPQPFTAQEISQVIPNEYILPDPIGSTAVSLATHREPLQYTTDPDPTEHSTHVYGVETITWHELPLETTIIVEATSSGYVFVGTVTDCRL